LETSHCRIIGQGRPDGKGGYLITLDRHVVDRLTAMRYSGVRG